MQRNKIAFFGTSHTFGDCAEGINHHEGQLRFVEKPWPVWFAKELNKEFYNFGIGGADNTVMLDAILEAFNRGTMDEIDTLILEPRLSFDTVRLPYDHIDYNVKPEFEKDENELGKIDYSTHWLDDARHTKEHDWAQPTPLTESLWIRFSLMDLNNDKNFESRMKADYIGDINDKSMVDKDIKKYVELSKSYNTGSKSLEYLNLQFIKNVYMLCKGYGIDFYWLNFEAPDFENIKTFFDNDKNLIDVCLNPDKTVRSYMHSKKLNYVCSCGHFNEEAQPYISSYLLQGYNERTNN
tara:strand:+ start:1194 stop:2078 length:885 start_codon:yes stop_codon:yes gene_type:complete